MNFRWDMTEEDWKRLKDVHKNKIVDDGCFGICYVGGLCCNIQHAQDKDNWYVFANLFLVKEGATYGELRDGTGYLCYHDSPGVPIRCRSFTSFKIDILPRLKTWDSLDCSQDHLARRLGYSCGFQGFAL